MRRGRLDAARPAIERVAWLEPSEKVIVLGIFGIGVLAGVLDWYLVDPAYFGR
jgi:hypothetical protein